MSDIEDKLSTDSIGDDNSEYFDDDDNDQIIDDNDENMEDPEQSNIIEDNDIDDGEINDNLSETSELDLEVDTDDVVIDGDEEHYANIGSNIDAEVFTDDDEDEDDDSVDDDQRYAKLDSVRIEDYTKLYHNDIFEHNNSEVQVFAQVVRKNNIIVDDLHKTIPILTKYERARILGQRAKQINAGAPPMVEPKQDTIDGYLIAHQELEEKKLPFIIRRPLPFGGCEY